MKSISIVLVIIFALMLKGCSENDSQGGSDSDEQLKYGTIAGAIFDKDTGEPMPARVYAVGSDDSLYMAEKCIPYDRPMFKSRIGYSGRHFTTIGNTFTVSLPEGIAKIIIEHGKEYLPIEVNVPITAGKTSEIKFNLIRWINMNKNGWYSGDLHVHRPLTDLADLMIAEDLNVACPQTIWGQKKEPDLEKWIDKADDAGTIQIDDRHVFSVLSQEIERFKIGALLMHHTGKTILPVSEYEELGLPNISLIKLTRDSGGYIETEKPWWPESHIDVAVGNADFTEIANNHLTYRSYLPEHPRRRNEFRNDYPEGVRGYVEYVCDLYYAYLDCGFNVMPSAGSASGVLPNPLGHNRVYVKVDGEFTYENWFRALKAGHSFTTNGPMLTMTVNDSQAGETVTLKDKKAHVVCELYSCRPIDRIEIICDGECVHTIEPELSDFSAVIVASIPVSESGWICARCFEDIKDNARFAHTAPVFVTVPGKPFRPKHYAADYFLRKTQEVIAEAEKADFPSEEAREASMDVYRQALLIYKDLLQKSL